MSDPLDPNKRCTQQHVPDQRPHWHIEVYDDYVALAATPPAPALDVERLAQARHLAGFCRRPRFGTRGCNCAVAASMIAEQYAVIDADTPRDWPVAPEQPE